ncbi:protein RER1B-like [Pyrus ussuriensis x Pyrus communis]|uniref:Protein RER1B-like n=1 Tax=Pyrus ussuriensis x Pyrus communis TaxID=2448454 RepID=A0A5N5HPP8_9ROSA|nr:protein RER1B-like [Pyrus ussuriensis x Pyrus communis]
MEGVEGGDAGSAVAPLAKWRDEFSRTFQYYLDRSTPNPVHRWLGTLAVAVVYVLRVYYIQGFYIVSYGLGIYILNLLIGFLSPKVDPELEALDGASLPTRGSDEFKPFIRRLPEFKFWYSITKAFCIAFLMTFFSAFDVPVFWPILLCYWIVLFALTMKRQIMHMIKYKYVPFSIGKQTGFSLCSTPDGQQMSGRTYVVIFFFWAALTVITPTLVFLSETSIPYSDSNGEQVEGTKGRRLIGIIGYEAQRRPRVLPTTEAPTASPSLAQAPVSELKPGLKHGETSLVKVFIESLRFVINNTKFKLN